MIICTYFQLFVLKFLLMEGDQVSLVYLKSLSDLFLRIKDRLVEILRELEGSTPV